MATASGRFTHPCNRRDDLAWRYTNCRSESRALPRLEAQPSDRLCRAAEVLTIEAIEVLSERLRTQLQIQQHLMLAMEAAYQVGEKPVTATIAESKELR
jgi:hypothetical protein